MGVFAYKASAADATAVKGMIVADSPRAARDSLLMQSYVRSRDMLTLLSEEHGFVEH